MCVNDFQRCATNEVLGLAGINNCKIEKFGPTF